MVDALFLGAIKGNIIAIKDIIDRVDGKAVQHQILENNIFLNDESNVQVRTDIERRINERMDKDREQAGSDSPVDNKSDSKPL